jgi:hypothetical protein
MCCFSGEVRHVANTKIYARLDAAGGTGPIRQTLVYSMDFASAADVAMILPIPVARGSDEKAVTFTSLEKYAGFFELVDRAFPQPLSRGMTDEGSDHAANGPPQKRLEVQQVGAFEASFVPSPADLGRLDPRFRLPEAALAVLTRRATREATYPDMPQAEWDALPDYRDWGFCVFKLEASTGTSHAHPMAFSFPTRWPDRLFFPTAHVHDGRLPRAAAFDHALYLQTGGRSLPDGGPRWRESEGTLGAHVDAKLAAGLIAADDHVYKRELRGRLTNGDVLVAVEA